MRKIVLLAGIFTILMNTNAKADRYYEDSDYYYQDKSRVERIEQRYSEPVRRGYRKANYQEPHYERIKQNERFSSTRENYHQKHYYNQVEETNKIRPYIGLDIATSKIDFGTDDWVVDNYNGGYEYHDNKNEALSFVVGAKINKNFGIEAFYQTSNENEKKYYWDDGGNEEDKLSYTAMGVDAIAYMPINQEFELLAAQGLAQYDFETKYEDVHEEFGNLGGESKDFDSLGIRFGIGGQYNFNEHFALRAMAHYIKMTDDKYIKSMTELSMGIRYMF